MDKPAPFIVVGYSVHRKPFFVDKIFQSYLLRLQAEGSCEVTLNGTYHVLNPGDLLLCKPNDHYVLNIGADQHNVGKKTVRSSDYYLNCDNSWIAGWWDAHTPAKIHVGMDEQLINIWKTLIYEKRKMVDADQEIQEQLIRLLYLSAKRLIKNHMGSKEQVYLPYRIKNYIEKNATRILKLQEIAQFAGLGVTRTSQIFKDTFNQTIMEYVINVRLNMAKEQIVLNVANLEEICYSSGFQTYSYFSRSFHSKFGMSPSEFKQKNKLQ
jgi:AraC family transcriptional regulator of arabinose operon